MQPITFSSFASSELELLDAGGMGISIEPGGSTMTTALGTGTFSIDSDLQTPGVPSPFTVGDILTQTSEVSGSADSPSGFGEAIVLNGSLVTLSNSSSGPATAEFRFTYTWDAEVVRDTPTLEAGLAAPFFHLTGFAPSGAETLMIDSGGGLVAVDEWLVDAAVHLPLGPGALSSSSSDPGVTVLAYVTLPGGSPLAPQIDSFTVITDSAGNALHAPIPEASTLAIWSVLGTIAMVGVYRRRRRVT
jgi:hypothetical protein